MTPYLRGFGPTRFLSAKTPRSGQQAVLAHDVVSERGRAGLEQNRYELCKLLWRLWD
jgi:hypothetical protein